MMILYHDVDVFKLKMQKEQLSYHVSIPATILNLKVFRHLLLAQTQNNQMILIWKA